MKEIFDMAVFYSKIVDNVGVKKVKYGFYANLKCWCFIFRAKSPNRKETRCNIHINNDLVLLLCDFARQILLLFFDFAILMEIGLRG